jgi:flagellar motor switch protein FliN/FliY
MSENVKAQDTTTYQAVLDGIRHYADIPLKISVILGQREMKVRELLQLRPDSLLELPKSAGENVDIFINGRLVGYGEVLEMEGSAGIRLTDIYTQI